MLYIPLVLFLPLFLAAVTVVPSPSASPSPDVGGLKEIGHVRASACKMLVDSANSVIDVAIQNDQTLVQTIRALHTTRLNGNDLERRNSLDELDSLAKAINKQAVDANKKVKLLRDVAAHTVDSQKAKELLAFANALGGAIGRQDAISRDVSGFVNNLEERDMQQGRIVDDTFPSPPPGAVRPAYLPDDDAMAAGMANDFISRVRDIRADETDAGSHANGATSGC